MAISKRWDHPDDVLPRPPYTYGSKVSPLTKLLDAGHHGVKLTRRRVAAARRPGSTANGVYYDRYETDHYPDRRIFAGAVAQDARRGLRPALRHLPRRDDGPARHLVAEPQPPRRAAEPGAGRPAGRDRPAAGDAATAAVFADTNDPDYQALLASLCRPARPAGRSTRARTCSRSAAPRPSGSTVDAPAASAARAGQAGALPTRIGST